MGAGATIDQIVADDPGNGPQPSRLTELARSGQGSVSGTMSLTLALWSRIRWVG
jgi:hypothetical protein